MKCNVFQVRKIIDNLILIDWTINSFYISFYSLLCCTSSPSALIIPHSNNLESISEFLSFSFSMASNFLTLFCKSAIILSLRFVPIFSSSSSSFSFCLNLSSLFLLLWSEFRTNWWNLPLCPWWITYINLTWNFFGFIK